MLYFCGQEGGSQFCCLVNLQVCGKFHVRFHPQILCMHQRTVCAFTHRFYAQSYQLFDLCQQGILFKPITSKLSYDLESRLFIYLSATPVW